VKIPPPLKKGDTVIIAATARKTTKKAIDPAVKILKGWGLKVVFAPNLFKNKHQFAGSDKERAAGFQWALNDTGAKAIILACGGYGTIRIIDQLKFKKFLRHPKWIVGYSDATIVQSHLLNLGVASIHGTMAFQFNKNKEATESLRKVLFGEKLDYKAKPDILNRTGKAKGEIVGGNLSLLYALSGSRSSVSTKGKILFIEDLDEYLYHIDRMMMQLKRSGKLKNLKGLIVGGMSDMKDNEVPFGKTAEEIIYDAVREYNKYPVCFNFPAGHISRNLAFYMGKKAQLIVNKKEVSLKYL
jgi:muramoyltetrapeptide carboxypeptidase